MGGSELIYIAYELSVTPSAHDVGRTYIYERPWRQNRTAASLAVEHSKVTGHASAYAVETLRPKARSQAKGFRVPRPWNTGAGGEGGRRVVFTLPPSPRMKPIWTGADRRCIWHGDVAKRRNPCICNGTWRYPSDRNLSRRGTRQGHRLRIAFAVVERCTEARGQAELAPDFHARGTQAQKGKVSWTLRAETCVDRPFNLPEYSKKGFLSILTDTKN